ncbi:MAG: hypothetical protein Q7J98_13120 [Kiritimatiellia bacterium]|nr:hypothetical protein [Kiritimatiellia bacterium]
MMIEKRKEKYGHRNGHFNNAVRITIAGMVEAKKGTMRKLFQA